MRKPIRTFRQGRAAPKRRWPLAAIGAAVVAGLVAAAVLLRHELPTLLALVDGGPAQIQAKSLADRIRQVAHAPPATAGEPMTTTAGDRDTGSAVEAAAAFPELAAMRQGEDAITIAGWNFTGPDLKAIAPPERAWRTSFGSERVAGKTRRTVAGFEADIIAVFGIDTFETLRQALPAQDYFLISPPQLRNMALAQARTKQPFPIAAVAIALRRDAPLRAGRRVQMVFGDQLGGSEIEAALGRTPADLQAAAETKTLPFALEVLAGGSRLWVVAAAFGPVMNPRIAAWVAKRRADGEAVVVVGAGPQTGLTAAALDDPDYTFAARGASSIPARDAGCILPDVAMYGWRPGTALDDQTLLARLDPLWRTRPSGGDCVLMARTLVSAAPPPPDLDDGERAGFLFGDRGWADDSGVGTDGQQGLAVRPEPIPRPEPMRSPDRL